MIIIVKGNKNELKHIFLRKSYSLILKLYKAQTVNSNRIKPIRNIFDPVAFLKTESEPNLKKI